MSHRRMQLFGTRGRIEVEIPFDAPPDRACRIIVDDGAELGGRGEALAFPAVDQYALQGDRFAEAIRGVGDVPVPLEDAVANMAALDAIVRSTASGRWEAPR